MKTKLLILRLSRASTTSRCGSSSSCRWIPGMTGHAKMSFPDAKFVKRLRRDSRSWRLMNFEDRILRRVFALPTEHREKLELSPRSPNHSAGHVQEFVSPPTAKFVHVFSRR